MIKYILTKEDNKMENKDNVFDLQKMLEEKFEELFGTK